MKTQLTFLDLMNGQIVKIRNKKTMDMIVLNEDTGEVTIYNGDGTVYKTFKNLKKSFQKLDPFGVEFSFDYKGNRKYGRIGYNDRGAGSAKRAGNE